MLPEDPPLSAIPMTVLWNLYEAYSVAYRVLSGFAEQPWAVDTPAGEIIENEINRSTQAMSRIFDEARCRPFEDGTQDADAIAALWALRAVDDGDGLGAATQAMKDFYTARSHRHL